ncbi:MAG: T9SS type A sorting domain-containing protein [Bacteroidales bacterium]|nr:T9SS type A sorting domain-containing protein [Bacteroidales bacterium]
MQFLKKTILILSVTLIGLNYNYLSANPKNNQDTVEILLIGSSYFNYNNLQNLVKNLADSSGIKIFIEMHGNNGLYLSDHAVSSSTEAKINERDWDYIVLQGVGSLVAYPDSFTDHPVYPALITLRDKIYSNCESTKMVFCMPWAFEDGMTWYQNWTDTYEDMQIHIYNNTLQYSDEIGFEIAPVGWVWYAVLEEYNYPLHYLHMSDWNHPSLKGSYLMACVIYSVVFQESTVGIPYHGGISEEEADYFQAVASDIVLNNLELWNITPNSSDIEKISIQNMFHLYQNYPNPFSSKTTFEFYLPEKNEIEVAVYNITGKKIKTLLNEKKDEGHYSVSWNGNNESGEFAGNGIYFCKFVIGNGTLIIRQIILMK